METVSGTPMTVLGFPCWRQMVGVIHVRQLTISGVGFQGYAYIFSYRFKKNIIVEYESVLYIEIQYKFKILF